MVRLLVVDEDLAVGLLVEIVLPEAEVVEARRGRDGLVMACDECPDVILIERRLPDGDGFDLVRRLRQRRAHRPGEPEGAGTEPAHQIPIGVLVADYDPSDQARGLRAGADFFVRKPIGRELVSALEETLALAPADRRERRLAAAARLTDANGAWPLPPGSMPAAPGPGSPLTRPTLMNRPPGPSSASPTTSRSRRSAILRTLVRSPGRSQWKHGNPSAG